MKRNMHARTLAIVLATTTTLQVTGMSSQLLNGVPFVTANAAVLDTQELPVWNGQVKVTTSGAVTTTQAQIVATVQRAVESETDLLQSIEFKLMVKNDAGQTVDTVTTSASVHYNTFGVNNSIVDMYNNIIASASTTSFTANDGTIYTTPYGSDFICNFMVKKITTELLNKVDATTSAGVMVIGTDVQGTTSGQVSVTVPKTVASRDELDDEILFTLSDVTTSGGAKIQATTPVAVTWSYTDNGHATTNGFLTGIIPNPGLGQMQVPTQFSVPGQPGKVYYLYDSCYYKFDVEIGAGSTTPGAVSATINDDTNKVIGMTTDMEYSLDGAAYVTYDATIFGAIDFSGDHTLLVRFAAKGNNPCGPDKTFNFTTNQTPPPEEPETPKTPAAPVVTGDDTANTVAGMAEGMEYSLDGAEYVEYEKSIFDAINFSGNHTLVVRVADDGINGYGLKTELIFTTNSSSTGSGSSLHHSNSTGSSSSSSSESTTGTTSTSVGTTGTTATAQTATQAAALKVQAQAVASQMIAGQAITAQVAETIRSAVVTDVASTLGTGTTVGQSTTVKTADGNSVAVSTITKDGAGAGAVITAAKDSAATTIPVSASTGAVTAVYKYVPLLGKYIQVTDGVAIGATTITLPTQANATYVAATAAMPSAETVSAGWAQVNNNWYMVNKTGDPQTGWQKDSTNQWVYLSPKTAVMETGWKLDGSTWYKLGDNGYMQTGWIKDKDSWYYCNSNGSMASNTTVDGYTLGANGAWFK